MLVSPDISVYVSVKPYNEYTEEGNGFSFKNYNAKELLNTIDYALSIFKDEEKWTNLKTACMKTEFSWSKSIKEYKKVYRELVKNED